MIELISIDKENLEHTRSSKTLVICDETGISCKRLNYMRETLETREAVILMMLESQYIPGLRGWAKAQILASLCPNIEGIVTTSATDIKNELRENWQEVLIPSPVVLSTSEVIVAKEEVKQIDYPVTENPIDALWMDRVNDIVQTSNCWQDPAGCIFSTGIELLMEAVSTKLVQSDCKSIPFSFSDIKLKPGERMLFCDAMHAERVGVAKAAKQGISLRGSTMYITKFPCRDCAMAVIESGVSRVVFDKGSYGLVEVGDLFKTNGVAVERFTG